MTAAGFVLSWLAWCLLGLGVRKHHEALLRRQPSTTELRSMRAAGWLLLSLGFGLMVRGKGWEQGPVFWTATLMLSALAWVLLSTALARRGH